MKWIHIWRTFEVLVAFAVFYTFQASLAGFMNHASFYGEWTTAMVVSVLLYPIGVMFLIDLIRSWKPKARIS